MNKQNIGYKRYFDRWYDNQRKNSLGFKQKHFKTLIKWFDKESTPLFSTQPLEAQKPDEIALILHNPDLTKPSLILPFNNATKPYLYFEGKITLLPAKKLSKLVEIMDAIEIKEKIQDNKKGIFKHWIGSEKDLNNLHKNMLDNPKFNKTFILNDKNKIVYHKLAYPILVTNNIKDQEFYYEEVPSQEKIVEHKKIIAATTIQLKEGPVR